MSFHFDFDAIKRYNQKHKRKAGKQVHMIWKTTCREMPNERVHNYPNQKLQIIVNTKTHDFHIVLPHRTSEIMPAKNLTVFISCWNDGKKMLKAVQQLDEKVNILWMINPLFRERKNSISTPYF